MNSYFVLPNAGSEDLQLCHVVFAFKQHRAMRQRSSPLIYLSICLSSAFRPTSHLVRKDGKRSILVDPLPSESRCITINTEHTTSSADCLTERKEGREGREKDVPNTGSCEIFEDTLRDVDPAFCAGWASILHFCDQAFTTICSSAIVVSGSRR